ncbi:MAG: hypothetical protein KGI65_08025 [Acidobacteriota bacterium]|nr:hypothetical protein [Acidobacteriota bacterium]
MSATRFALVAALIFAALTLRVYWPHWPVSSHSIVGCACGDEIQEVWFLKWTPWSIAHGLNPLYSNWMDYPKGFNLAANTAMPALGVLAAPVTWLLGAVASYNLLLWLSFPLSALSAFWVLRRLSGSNLAALLGATLYGFSPYMIGEGVAHLFLVFVPLPPLILYCLYQVTVVQEGSARRWGLLLAALFVAQVLISQEVAAEAVIVAACALVVALVVYRREVSVERVRYALRALLIGAVPVVVILAYPVYYQFFGPQHFTGAAHATSHSPLKLDLLGTVVPDSSQSIAPGALARIGNGFMGGDYGENGGYLGIPLVLALGLIAVTLRRRRGVLYTALVLVVVEVLSMGQSLTIDNHTFPVPMPWRLVNALPSLQSALANRLALYASLLVALVVALGASEWIVAMRRPPRGPTRRRVGVDIALGVLLVASLLVYQTRTPIVTVPLPTLPSFFSNGDAAAIPEGSTVLTYPLSVVPNAPAMIWQVSSDFRWKMVGGEAIVPTRRGHATGQPIADRPLPVSQFLTHWSAGTARLPALNARLIDQMREYLRLNDVATVLVDPAANNAAHAITLFADAMGPPLREGDMDVWFHAPARADAWLSRHSPS